MTFVINGSSGATQSASFDSASTFGFKNRIINGAMMIDQRNAGASVTPTTSAYTLDRWQANISTSSKFSVQQSSTAPTGFIKSLVATSLSAYSVGASDYFSITQPIEGLNISDFGWGAAGASTVTLSFWVRSSLTGTFGGALQNSAFNRSYPFSYSISSSNTWEQKTITIAGDTSGTWLTTNGVGIYVQLGLGVGTTYSGAAGSWAASNYVSATGATSVVGTNGATFYVTGVQLEKGTAATSFDYRPYGTELALCQRYYYKTLPGSQITFQSGGVAYSTTASRTSIPFVVPMRTAPSALEQSGTANNYAVLNNGGWTTCSAVPAFAAASTDGISVTFTVASGLTAGGGVIARAETSAGYLGWSAEL